MSAKGKGTVAPGSRGESPPPRSGAWHAQQDMQRLGRPEGRRLRWPERRTSAVWRRRWSMPSSPAMPRRRPWWPRLPIPGRRCRTGICTACALRTRTSSRRSGTTSAATAPPTLAWSGARRKAGRFRRRPQRDACSHPGNTALGDGSKRPGPAIIAAGSGSLVW